MKQSDIFRLTILNYLASTPSLEKAWDIWQPLINNQLGNPIKGQDIFDLGEHISDIFQGNRVEGRGQDSVSGGGNAWECIITWYLNLVFWGTNVVATRQNKKFVPEIINNALTVSISNQQTNTESDILVYEIPYSEQSDEVTINTINKSIQDNLSKTSLSVVQCKTNWNDNAQIPMLWDLIYNSSSFRIPNVSVGVQGVNPYSFKRFAYSFVTVPTVKTEFTPKKLAVLRVKNLTGGNYWGKPNKSGVASCINEFFLRNFPNTFSGGVIEHLENNLINNPKILSKFLNLEFS